MHDLIVKVLDDVRGSWRFRWWALGAAWLLCVVGWLYVLTLPNVFEASARVYVDTQSALRPLLQGLAIEPNVESNLALVRQAILSRPNLEKVARDTDLALRAKTPEEMERLVDGLKKRIAIDSVRAGSDGVYRITFQDFNREKTLEVVQTLLDSFVEDTLGIKRLGQEDAQRFLVEQIAEYEKRLAEAEARVSEFKQRNVGLMPDGRGDYFARLQSELVGLEEARTSLKLAETRQAEMERQLAGEEPFVFGFDAPSSGGASSAAGGADVGARIRENERKLEDLLLRFTERHPDVIAVRATIDTLKAQREEEIARLRRDRVGTGSLANSVKTNPVYQAIQVELKRAGVQVAELRQDVAQRSARVAELRRLVNTIPEVEAELARLTRDYDVTRGQYQQLVQRLETARLSEEAERTGSVKFEIIDPPAVSTDPVAPDRLLLLTAVLLLSVLAAAALAYGVNVLRPVFHNARALAEIVGYPVLGVVSRTWTLRGTQARRVPALTFYAATGGLFVAYGLIIAWRDIALRLAAGSG